MTGVLVSWVASGPTRMLRTADLEPSHPITMLPSHVVPSVKVVRTDGPLKSISANLLSNYQVPKSLSFDCIFCQGVANLNIDAFLEKVPHLPTTHSYRIVRMNPVEQLPSLAVVARKKVILAGREVEVFVAPSLLQTSVELFRQACKNMLGPPVQQHAPVARPCQILFCSFALEYLKRYTCLSTDVSA